MHYSGNFMALSVCIKHYLSCAALKINTFYTLNNVSMYIMQSFKNNVLAVSHLEIKKSIFSVKVGHMRIHHLTFS